jgi:hypothetical protein
MFTLILFYASMFYAHLEILKRHDFIIQNLHTLRTLKFKKQYNYYAKLFMSYFYLFIISQATKLISKNSENGK